MILAVSGPIDRPIHLKSYYFPGFRKRLRQLTSEKVAVQTLLSEWPEIAWNLIIQLLPGQQPDLFRFA